MSAMAVVFGGGGVAGIAWQIGLVAALKENDVDLVRHAALIVGTSAGSVVGANLATECDVKELYEHQLSDKSDEPKPTVPLSSFILAMMKSQFFGLFGGGQKAVLANMGKYA